MACPQVVSLITTSLVGIALVSAVVEDAQAQSAARQQGLPHMRIAKCELMRRFPR